MATEKRKRKYDDERHNRKETRGSSSSRSRNKEGHLRNRVSGRWSTYKDYSENDSPAVYKRHKTRKQSINTKGDCLMSEGCERKNNKRTENDMTEDVSVNEQLDVHKGANAKVVKPNNCFGDIEVTKNETYYRSNMRTAIKEINSLSFGDKHIKAIKMTPFWFLFQAIYTKRYEKLMKRCHKYEDDIRRIIRTFDKESGNFVIGGEYLQLTGMNAKLIFGITGGCKTVSMKTEGKTDGDRTPDWVKRCFRKQLNKGKKTFVLYKPHILDNIRKTLGSDDETSVKDTSRLIHCYEEQNKSRIMKQNYNQDT